MRYTIKHEPTNKFINEDESGVYFLETDNHLWTCKTKKLAEDWIEHLGESYTSLSDPRVHTENGNFPLDEFIIVEV
jgi:hypothetical protein